MAENVERDFSDEYFIGSHLLSSRCQWMMICFTAGHNSLVSQSRACMCSYRSLIRYVVRQKIDSMSRDDLSVARQPT